MNSFSSGTVRGCATGLVGNETLQAPDTPQFRGGNPYFFSENLYKSVSFIIHASMYRENVHTIHIAIQFAKKSRHCVIKIDSQQQRTKIGALRGAAVGLGLHL